MKTLKFTVLILTMLTVNGCDKDPKNEPIIDGINSYYDHLLSLSFQDVSGNDLLEGLEIVKLYDLGGTVKPELYTLDIIFEDGIPNPWQQANTTYAIYNKRYPELTLNTGNYNSLIFTTQSYKYTGLPEALLYGSSIEKAEFAEKITFRVTCSYLFGNNETHDIVTWWKQPESGFLSIPYRVEFEGKEFPIENNVVATIILNR